jgi:hypothetical protein
MLEEEDLTVEEILRRCIELLHGLNEDELKAKIATGHKVVVMDGENFYWIKNALLSWLDFIEKEAKQ